MIIESQRWLDEGNFSLGNKWVFILVWNAEHVSACPSWQGRLFQRKGQECEKERYPHAYKVHVHRMLRRKLFVERSLDGFISYNPLLSLGDINLFHLKILSTIYSNFIYFHPCMIAAEAINTGMYPSASVTINQKHSAERHTQSRRSHAHVAVISTCKWCARESETAMARQWDENTVNTLFDPITQFNSQHLIHLNRLLWDFLWDYEKLHFWDWTLYGGSFCDPTVG